VENNGKLEFGYMNFDNLSHSVIFKIKRTNWNTMERVRSRHETRRENLSSLGSLQYGLGSNQSNWSVRPLEFIQVCWWHNQINQGDFSRISDMLLFFCMTHFETVKPF
jgi:hypothetical protein